MVYIKDSQDCMVAVLSTGLTIVQWMDVRQRLELVDWPDGLVTC